MTTVFLSGSRSISRLAAEVRLRLDNIISNELEVVVGDANGADKAMQKHFAQKQYRLVTVFHVGVSPRNNVGNWPTQSVEASSALKGWEYYANKDKVMAKSADFGLVIWDGESAGSIHNVFELLSYNKKIVIFFAPEKEFVSANETDDALRLLNRTSPEVMKAISAKIRLPKYLTSDHSVTQKAFGF